MSRKRRFLATVMALAASCSGARAAAPPRATTPEQDRFFETKVRPLLVDQCLKCHGPEKQKGGLRLDARAAAITGGQQGAAVVPGKPDESLLVTAVRHDDDLLKMPPSKKLTPAQVADLTEWVKMGAPWPGAEASDAAPGPSPVKKGPKEITAKDREHWAFQPLKRPPVPTLKNAEWVRNPIDAFILQGLESRGLTPNPPASKIALIRRVTYDLTGLPPTPAEVDAFLNDHAPDAYERLVDRLLASPHYGEKWGRHWLDLVRFAETNSYERDNPKPSAWRYRDYVIRSFNQDKSYQRFIREQIAGDEAYPGDVDALIATGYYRLGIWDDEPTDREQALFDSLDDIVATTGQVVLGMTVDCARCHDHKIDPITQKDYYKLVAFFRNINHFRNGGPTDEAPIFTNAADQASYAARIGDLESNRRDLRDKIAVIEAELTANAKQAGLLKSKDVRQLIQRQGEKLLGAARFKVYQGLRKALRELETAKPTAETALCVTEPGRDAPATFVLLRGNPHVQGDKVEPGFLTVLGMPEPTIPKPPAGAKTSGRRTVLADWLTSPAQPLTPRVIANRLWQHHFGRGIVRSPNNFGVQGDRPTHPALLDWLASELVANDWRLKPIHRLILTSNAYRMSSEANSQALAQDPMNDAFWRFDMRRLTAEEVRDSILAVGGNLSLRMFGPGVYPQIPPEVMAGQSIPGKGWGQATPEEAGRRSVYIHVKRSLVYPILESFDLAETDRSSPVRFSTTQPTQALAMLNSSFLNDQARLLARRLRVEAGEKTEEQVRLAFRLTTSRAPSAAELKRGADLMAALQSRDGMTADDARNDFALVVLSLNEFFYLD